MQSWVIVVKSSEARRQTQQQNTETKCQKPQLYATLCNEIDLNPSSYTVQQHKPNNTYYNHRDNDGNGNDEMKREAKEKLRKRKVKCEHQMCRNLIHIQRIAYQHVRRELGKQN